MASCGTLTVEPVFDSSGFEVSACPNPPDVTAGEQYTQSITVANSNSQSATGDVVLAARPPGQDGNRNNVILAQETVTVSGNGTNTVDVSYTAPDQDGEWDLLAYTSNISSATVSGASRLSSIPGNFQAAGEALSGVPRKGTLATAAAGVGAAGIGTLLTR